MIDQVSPAEILAVAYRHAMAQLDNAFVEKALSETIRHICYFPHNRAPVRLLLACCLAKTHDPSVDIRKPYTELGDSSFSGRAYDEGFVGAFINEHDLPCNPTTAFLTPAFRTKPVVLEFGTALGGRPKHLYEKVIQVLDAVENGDVNPRDLLAEVIRYLLRLKQERRQRMQSLIGELQHEISDIPLSSEDIVDLIDQHLRQPRAARLPVLVVAAAYQAVSDNLGERVLPLQSHNAADEQTGALGDVEITLMDDNRVVTSYEMKMKQVSRNDIDRALQKIGNSSSRIDNYIFITTDRIDDEVADYAKSLYQATGGIEFAILDCIGFLRHFLHLFHRLRLDFLEGYQSFVLNEPESAVRQELKEVFLNLRRVAESKYAHEE